MHPGGAQRPHVQRPEHSLLEDFLYFTLYWFWFYFSWTTAYLALSYSITVQEQERHSAELAMKAQEAQVRALRYQINPHFLFNTLNAIAALVRDAPARAEEMVVQLSDFFRRSLAVNPMEDVTLAQEVDLQRLYLEIERTRFPDRLRFDVALDGGSAEARVPALLLQPLVENAVKHGVARSEGSTCIRIRARLDGPVLEIVVENDARHRATAPAARRSACAMSLDRLRSRFGDGASLATARSPGRLPQHAAHPASPLTLVARDGRSSIWAPLPPPPVAIAAREGTDEEEIVGRRGSGGVAGNSADALGASAPTRMRSSLRRGRVRHQRRQRKGRSLQPATCAASAPSRPAMSASTDCISMIRRIHQPPRQRSNVRVGLTAQGYPFPAPTGVADFSLRSSGNEAILSPVLYLGPYGTARGNRCAAPDLRDGSASRPVSGYRYEENFPGEEADADRRRGSALAASGSESRVNSFYGRRSDQGRLDMPSSSRPDLICRPK